MSTDRYVKPGQERYERLADAMDGVAVQAKALWEKWVPEIDPPDFQALIEEKKDDIESD
jgi:hypothetical protein